MCEKGSPANADTRDAREAAVYRLLDSLGIAFDRLDHPPVLTMDDCAGIDACLGGEGCKLLFLTDRQTHYLLMLPGGKRFSAREFSEKNGFPKLKFASEEALWDKLRLKTGAVTPMGLMNDTSGCVTFLLDEDVLRDKALICHPCVNTTTIRLSMSDFLERVLPALGHEPVRVVL